MPYSVQCAVLSFDILHKAFRKKIIGPHILETMRMFVSCFTDVSKRLISSTGRGCNFDKKPLFRCNIKLDEVGPLIKDPPHISSNTL